MFGVDGFKFVKVVEQYHFQDIIFQWSDCSLGKEKRNKLIVELQVSQRESWVKS